MNRMRELIAEAAPLAETREGLGIEERQVAELA